MVSKNFALTRSHEDAGMLVRTRLWPALHPHRLAPVVALQRAVKCQPNALDARYGAELLFHLLVQGRKRRRFISGARGIQVQDITICGLNPEILMFQVAQRLGKQAGAHQQHQRQGRLKDD